MKRFNLVILSAMAVLVFVSGCKKDTTGVVPPDFRPTPAALTFNACPSKDSSGNTVAGVFPDTKKFTINNRGNVSADLGLTITGAGAANFSLGTMLPTSIDKLGDVEIPVSFSPTAQGDVSASVVIDDNTEGTENTLVALIGTGINLPAQPAIETGPQKKDGSGFLACNAESTIADCSLDFPDTLIDDSSTLQVKIMNKGCPALKITGIVLTGEGFTLDTPSSPPTPEAPLTLSTADGSEEFLITVRFNAVDDQSGSSSQFHLGTLKILSNDPANGSGDGQPSLLGLNANAIKPSIYVSPTTCNFANPQDACGNTAVMTGQKAKFKVTNDGSTPILISSVKFRSSGTTTGTDGRFTVTTSIQGQTLMPTAAATIEVSQVDQPLLVSDQLEIVADIPGLGVGSGGKVVTTVISGIKPCLTTDPTDNVDFGNPADELSVKRITIKNGANCGDLKIGSIKVSAQPRFTIVEPLVPVGFVLRAGEQTEASVQYSRPPSGGQQLADLTIVTNDTDYGAPQYKLMLLQSNAALNEIPVAALTSCSPAQLLSDPTCAAGSTSSATYNLSMLSTPEITLSGINSTDDTMVAKYRFVLSPPFPPNVTAANLAGNNMPITTPTTKLTIPAGGVGTYRVRLQVIDDRGQQSGADSTMSINVYQ